MPTYFQRLIELTRPFQQYEHFLDIPIHALAKDGYRHYIIDVDNTLALRHRSVMTAEVTRLIKKLKKDQIINGVCLLSNITYPSATKVQRIAELAHQLDCQYICATWPKNKPHGRPFQRALAALGAEPAQTIVIGDQLLTDVVGANRLGMKAILVTPLGRDHFLTRIKRQLERWLKKLHARSQPK